MAIDTGPARSSRQLSPAARRALLFGNGRYFARFMLTPKPGSRPSVQARVVAVMLADQVGRALSAGTPSRSAP